MRTFYFYSVPSSKVPSPYFRGMAAMLRDLSRKGILRFKLWQGSHEAPMPVEDDEPCRRVELIDKAEVMTILAGWHEEPMASIMNMSMAAIDRLPVVERTSISPKPQ